MRPFLPCARRRALLLAATLVLLVLATTTHPPPASAGPVFTGPLGTEVQVTGPRGAHAGEKPRGIVLVIHGGGWKTVGPGVIQDERPFVDWVTRAGWQAVNIDYHAGLQSVTDAEAMYDWARRRYGTRLPYCALGESAGAHLALMVAAHRPSLAGAVGLGAPTDLAALATTSPDIYTVLVETTFGTDLAPYSPVSYARSLGARVLLATAADDTIFPTSQITAFLAADPRATAFVLGAGTHPFTHADVDPDQLDAFVGHLRDVLHGLERPVQTRRLST